MERVKGASDTSLFDQLGIQSPDTQETKKIVRPEQGSRAAKAARKEEERLNRLIELHHEAVEERNKCYADKLERIRQAQAAALAAKMERRRRKK